jgi:hypothetical protein
MWRPRIGDAVRVRRDLTSACVEVPHTLAEAGHTGVVVGNQAMPRAPSHRYLVAFDPPLPHVKLGDREISLAVRSYTADELQPLG